jgi:hypothetical protein
MRRLAVCVCWSLLCSGVLLAQNAGIKSYSSYEDYCRDNPHAPTCKDGKPIKFDPNNNIMHPDGGACRNPNSAACRAYCRDNPKVFVCLNLNTPNSTGPSTRSSAQPASPRVINIPGGPARVAPPAAPAHVIPADWRFAQPHPDLLASIDAAAVRQSPTLRALLVQLAAPLHMTPAELDDALTQTNDIDRCWISVRSSEPLLLLQGQFHARVGPTDIGNGKMVYGLSENALVFGSSAAVTSAMQRLRGTLAASSARPMKIDGAESDLWVMGTSANLKEAHVSLSSLADGLSSYMLGVSLRDGVKAELRLEYASVAGARRAAATVRDSPPPADWPVHVASEMMGTQVRVKVTVEQAELSAALAKALAGPSAKPVLDLLSHYVRNGQMVVYGTGAPKVLEPTPNAPPPPGKLVIYGMPGGPKVM